MCIIPRNTPHFFVSPSDIPDNRCLTEFDFIRENPPFPGQVIDFEQLIRKAPPAYGQTCHFESTFSVIGSWWRAGQPRTEKKTKHPC